MVVAAQVTLADGSRLSPELNVFATSTQAIATPAIVPGPSADLYVTLLDLDPKTGVATLRVGVHPLVSWIWPAGALVALGGALAVLPVQLGRRRLVPFGGRNATRHRPAAERR
jgi:cytochrome c biogenesis factor